MCAKISPRSASVAGTGIRSTEGSTTTSRDVPLAVSITEIEPPKKFATKNVLVRILGPNGADYQTINPTEIPAEIEVYLDVQSVTEESKAQKMALADKYIAFLMQSELRVNWQEMNTYYAEITDVRHPERFVIEFAPTDPAFAGEPLQQSGNIQNQSAPIRSPESTAPDRGQLIS